MERTPNKSQHRKITLEKNIFPPLLSGLELATFRPRGRRSNQRAIPAHMLSYIENVQNIFICRLRVVVLSIDATKGLYLIIFVSNFSSLECGHVGSLFTDEEHKRLARDVLLTSATRASLDHGDITDTNCQVQNDSTQGRTFATFKCRLKKKR